MVFTALASCLTTKVASQAESVHSRTSATGGQPLAPASHTEALKTTYGSWDQHNWPIREFMLYSFNSHKSDVQLQSC